MYYHSNKFCIGICEKVLKLLKRVQFRLRESRKEIQLKKLNVLWVHEDLSNQDLHQ